MFNLKDLLKGPTKEEGIKIGRYFVIGLCQIILVILALCVYDSYHKTRIGIVNITGIADEFIKVQTRSGVSPEELKKIVRFFGSSLEKILHDVGAKKRVVLMPAEAVITGAKDYTQEVQQQLSLAMKQLSQEKQQQQSVQQAQEINQAVTPGVVQSQQEANQALQPVAVQVPHPAEERTDIAADVKRPGGKTN